MGHVSIICVINAVLLLLSGCSPSSGGNPPTSQIDDPSTTPSFVPANSSGVPERTTFGRPSEPTEPRLHTATPSEPGTTAAPKVSSTSHGKRTPIVGGYEQVVYGATEEESKVATVIALHGRNGNFRDLFSLGEATWHQSLGNRVKFIYLKSPPSGEWFRFKSASPLQMMADISRGTEIADLDSLCDAIAPLESLIDQEAQSLGTHKKVYLLGYSQGGMMALWHGLKTTNPLGGVIAINSAVPVVNMMAHAFPTCSTKPIVHFHGTNDTIVPPNFAQRGHELAQRAGCSDYSLQLSPGGHDMSHHVGNQVNAWLINHIP